MFPNMAGQSPKTDKAIKSGVTFVTPPETVLEMVSERWKKLAADHDAAIVAVGRRQDIGSAQYVGGRGILTPAGIKKYLHNVISDRMDIYKRANGFFTGAIGPKANSFDYYYSEAEAILQIVDAIPVAEPEKPQPEQ